MLISERHVVYEDNHLIAINKPAGELVQADNSGDIALNDSVMEYLKIKYNKPGKVYLGTLHRLDRPVRGLVLFAKTSKAAERMSAMFKEHEVVKTYYAIVDQIPQPTNGTIKSHLVKDTKMNIVQTFSKPVKDSKEAVLHYRLISSNGDSSLHLLKVNPITGRPHQIRVQLSSIGCPIYGDVKYGSDFVNQKRALFLLSFSMEFVHPVTKMPITLQIPWPPDNPWKQFERATED